MRCGDSVEIKRQRAANERVKILAEEMRKRREEEDSHTEAEDLVSFSKNVNVNLNINIDSSMTEEKLNNILDAIKSSDI